MAPGSNQNEQQWSRDLNLERYGAVKKETDEGAEETDEREGWQTAESEMRNEDETVIPDQEKKAGRTLDSVRQMARETVEEAEEMVKQQVKRVVKRTVMQALWAVIVSIVSFLAANWWIILIIALVFFIAIYINYLYDNPKEIITSLGKINCAAQGLFGVNFDCWADAIFK